MFSKYVDLALRGRSAAGSSEKMEMSAAGGRVERQKKRVFLYNVDFSDRNRPEQKGFYAKTGMIKIDFEC